MTPKQIRFVHGLLKKAGLTEMKADLAFAFSEQVTDSLADMTHSETQALIKYLSDYIGLPPDPADRMRKKILSLAHEMHWELPGGRVDMERVDNWCIRYSGLNKPLDAINYSDLPSVVTQFENVYRSFLKGI